MSRPIAEIYQYCPVCGTQAECTGVNPFVCHSCNYKHFFSPVAAVGAIIVDPSGRVLLITRARDPGKGMYGMPGGFVDPNESLEEALQREVLEEINLRAKSIRYLVSYPNEYAYAGSVFPVADAFFLCEVESFDAIAAQEGEVSGFSFLHLSEEVLSNLAFESNRRALEFYQTHRSA